MKYQKFNIPRALSFYTLRRYYCNNYDVQLGNDAEVIRLLLEAGADINASDNEGFTPLIIACGDKIGMAQGGMNKVVDIMLDFNPEIDSVTSKGITALQFAAYYSFSPEVLDNLLEAGADVHIKNDGGYNAITFLRANEELKEKYYTDYMRIMQLLE